MTPAEIAYRDQYRAAESEVRRVLNRSAAQTGTAVRGTEASWIRERFAEFGRTMVAGEGTFCPHITRSPMVGHTAAWATDRLVCVSCAGELQSADVEDRCCDRCGQFASPLYSGSAAHGPVLMAYRLCAPCAHAVE